MGCDVIGAETDPSHVNDVINNKNPLQKTVEPIRTGSVNKKAHCRIDDANKLERNINEQNETKTSIEKISREVDLNVLPLQFG